MTDSGPRFWRSFDPLPLLMRVRERFLRKSQGSAGVDELGHRTYVGGKWEILGRLQFQFMVDRGLLPGHTLLDVGCGSLRAGIHFIPYLDRGRYLGIEKEATLLRAGIQDELGVRLLDEKRPRFVVSSRFAVDLFGVTFDYAIANSLFTHLTPDLIRLCLAETRRIARPESVFYASFFETHGTGRNPSEPHDHRNFFYTYDTLEELADQTGWAAEYIGDWGHPRGQRMCAFHVQ